MYAILRDNGFAYIITEKVREGKPENIKKRPRRLTAS